MFCIIPGYVGGMCRYGRTSTARANVDVVVGFKRARRARVIDCHIKALRASSVETYPVAGLIVLEASAFKEVSEVGEKLK